MSPKGLRRCSSSISNDSTINIIGVQELRAKITKEKILAKCTISDLNRIKNEDWWLASFLASCHYDQDIAFAVFMECLKWRQAFEVEYISLLAIKPLLDRQLMYVYGRDLSDNTLMWINLANYRCDEAEFEKLFIFWMERHYITSRGAPTTIFFDMTSTKMKNMDLNMFKFLLKAMKYYYPATVRDILIFESPAMLNAPWKVVRSWLDVGHPLLHHIDRNTAPHFIDTQYLLYHQGGESKYSFTMNDIAKCLPEADPIPTAKEENGFTDSKANLDNYPMRRSVKFDDSEEEAGRKTPLTLTRRPSKGPGKRLPPTMRPVADRRMSATEVEWLKSAFVSISPRDELILTKVDGEADFVDVVAVKNQSKKGVMFKIKTTSPEKFRVRPSTGIIPAESTEAVRVYLQNEYKYSCTREKFLLMAVETDETNIENFSEVWKSAASESKVEHKVKCKVMDDGSSDGSNDKPERKSSILSSQQSAIDGLRQEIRQTANTQRLIIVVLGFLFATQLIAMMYERSNYQSLRLAFDALTSKQVNPVLEKVIETVATPYVDEDL